MLRIRNLIVCCLKLLNCTYIGITKVRLCRWSIYTCGRKRWCKWFWELDSLSEADACKLLLHNISKYLNLHIPYAIFTILNQTMCACNMSSVKLFKCKYLTKLTNIRSVFENLYYSINLVQMVIFWLCKVASQTSLKLRQFSIMIKPNELALSPDCCVLCYNGTLCFI